MPFELVSHMAPKGDQPRAVERLGKSLADGQRSQVLLGITGSGKTFTIANVIAAHGRPALIMAPNKTLAAQLFAEMKSLFPNNAVEYFVSYYDYYQPEAYIPTTDTFIEKDAMINEQIDRMRHSATRSLLARDDVIIVSSVSCIYGIGSAEWYREMLVNLKVGEEFRRDDLLIRLVDVQYNRSDADFHRGTFRVRGDVVEVYPAHAEKSAIRIEYWGDEIERLREINPVTGSVICDLDEYSIFPGSHYVTPEEQRRKAISNIREELQPRLQELEAQGKLLERQRLEQRTMFDLEMLEEVGFCHGIENYSRHLSKRSPGEPPPTLLDYFPKDYLAIIDESHITVSQIGGMFRGDRARKEVLVEHGFRLPSALDNRPLQFDEWNERVHQVIFVSATPGDYELEQTQGEIVEQVIRPTGLLDPVIHVRPVSHQVDDLLKEIRVRVERNERVLVTTLTKRMSEDLTEYMTEVGVKVRYLHSDIDTLERIEILRDLRTGEFDVLIGINLLREGLDLPEVSLVAILDADKEGFLRSARSLVQTIGRAARNVHGEVVMYADRITKAMDYALSETQRRRAVQQAYNTEHGITPETVQNKLKHMEFDATSGQRDYVDVAPRLSMAADGGALRGLDVNGPSDLQARIQTLRAEMLAAAEQLDFEKAASLRDELESIQQGASQEESPKPKSGGAKGKAARKNTARRNARSKSKPLIQASRKR